MSVNYKDFQNQIASELSALGSAKSTAAANKSCMLSLELSEFPTLPAGTKARMEAVPAAQLQPGDYVMVNAQPNPVLRRFVSFSASGDPARLMVANGSGHKQNIPAAHLLGRLCEVFSHGKTVDPNPAGFLQRAVFKFRHR